MAILRVIAFIIERSRNKSVKEKPDDILDSLPPIRDSFASLGSRNKLVSKNTEFPSQDQIAFRYCPSCGENNEPGSIFCGNCGKRLVAGNHDPSIQ